RVGAAGRARRPEAGDDRGDPLRRRSAGRRHAGRSAEGGRDGEAGRGVRLRRVGQGVSDLFAPLSGKVVKVNSPLADSPEYVNEDPYDEGWMIQVAVGDSKELDGLLDA